MKRVIAEVRVQLQKQLAVLPVTPTYAHSFSTLNKHTKTNILLNFLIQQAKIDDVREETKWVSAEVRVMLQTPF